MLQRLIASSHAEVERSVDVEGTQLSMVHSRHICLVVGYRAALSWLAVVNVDLYCLLATPLYLSSVGSDYDPCIVEVEIARQAEHSLDPDLPYRSHAHPGNFSHPLDLSYLSPALS